MRGLLHAPWVNSGARQGGCGLGRRAQRLGPGGHLVGWAVADSPRAVKDEVLLSARDNAIDDLTYSVRQEIIKRC
jgi:hypothetical protein